MRFYAIGKTSRIWTTILWAVVVIIWSSMALAESHRRPYTTWLWLFVAVVNLSNVWTNYLDGRNRRPGPALHVCR